MSIISDISGSIQHSFSSNLKRRPARIKIARRSHQFWRDKESLCLTASFIADLFDGAFIFSDVSLDVLRRRFLVPRSLMLLILRLAVDTSH